jgi:hypothetical protein
MVMRIDLNFEFKAWQLERETWIGIKVDVWPAREGGWPASSCKIQTTK